MKNKELQQFLIGSKKRVDKASEEFEIHSKEFDRKVAKILAGL